MVRLYVVLERAKRLWMLKARVRRERALIQPAHGPRMRCEAVGVRAPHVAFVLLFGINPRSVYTNASRSL